MFLPFLAPSIILHHQVKILKWMSDRFKERPGIFESLNKETAFLYEDCGNGNLIALSLSFEKSMFTCAAGKEAQPWCFGTVTWTQAFVT